MFRGGRVIASGSLQQLRASVDSIRFSSSQSIDITVLSRTLGVPVKVVTETSYVIETSSNPQVLGVLAQWMSDNDLPLTDVRTGHETLIEMYRRITGGES
jgi:hypothetical protein